ncbi:hypothetical protein N7K92_15615 [Vibrio parahaemolyticus]|uniref:hypothetical protein n=1 Tax=Vibrio parahaemolyticus TaxID=670 RepID=UPI001D2E4C86|nr:hypothetical protein [Vibrio parahaemolyticus]EGQ8497819.1 hypothetical protein [Vibrio alginolyticus]MDW1566877.1 hypothetical protein [Vibrio sp. YT-15]MDW2198055.1 hypothetical protein [Vibrio sp. 2084]EGQ8499210.1 hypothetical protein [Vibrio alginolyticus]EGQ8705470.1 hypothetical protein [Vibrio parahaemolyticus]
MSKPCQTNNPNCVKGYYEKRIMIANQRQSSQLSTQLSSSIKHQALFDLASDPLNL